ncbi:FCS-Like Zinc finger 8-like [Musa acuminata AAA Group]|uniref:FCS-Like Zinc finger 8-like n=1 Tax=Musa acuminata AAA Group TaxID=214697 RepID=UPI0031D419D7
MSDPASLLSSNAASLFTSPRLLVGFSPKSTADPEAGACQTSILETKPFSAIRNPFFFCRNSIMAIFSATVSPISANECRQLPRENGEPRAIGLGLLEVLTAGDSVKKTSKTEKRMVVFGSQFKIQIPPLPTDPPQFSSTPTTDSGDSLQSPIEFGIKTRNSLLALYSPARRSSAETGRMGSDTLNSSPRVSTGCLPQSEMELSEDYTCVILHGPNRRTTHIYDNCIIESCCDGFATSANEIRSSNDQSGYASDDFLSFCCGCKKKIGPGEDVYMYRERTFCSHECRYQEMFDEGKEKC